MVAIVYSTESLKGEFQVPASKSHTIRAVIISSLAQGKSTLIKPLHSGDTQAAVNACISLGAQIECQADKWEVYGFGGCPHPPSGKLDLMNSGTSFNLLAGVTSLAPFETILDGDNSLRSRPVQPLLNALNQLGARAISLNGNGCPPISVQGIIKGGRATIDGLNSQFVSSLLISCPLAESDTELTVVNLREAPYVKMTLAWLDEQEIIYDGNENLTHFYIKGQQHYRPFQKQISGDWSTATFPLVAAAITNSDVLLRGLDLNDTQGDKVILDYLQQMGVNIRIEKAGIRLRGGSKLHGIHLDLNETPDALPALSVLGCLAEGTTILDNVPQARIKETDRIAVMAKELSKLGAKVQEKKDGLIIHQSLLQGTEVNGHHDHRVVMALSLAGLRARGKTIVRTAEAARITFPDFFDMLTVLGATVEVKSEQ
ncbi:MAG: 3-phosphoshikimate 1-carboxyvinyltransferase [Candidatus Omnitrophica bacterium]|nr:3-phosphoshikimate 1-carboxyvinyltransferase [Candidatus Omnitrophota bacterium]